MRKFYLAITGATALLIAGACSDATRPPSRQVAPSNPRHVASGVSGATYTTNNLAVDNPDPPGTVTTCLNGNGEANAIDCNIYADKQFVWLTGGPSGGNSSLEDGTYFFAVLDPGGQKNDVNDGQRGNTFGGDVTLNKNLSDENDAYTNRTFVVQSGKIVTYTGGHDHYDIGTASGGTTDLMIRLMLYSNTANNGGEYDMAICKIDPATYNPATHPVSAASCKYDNFKVRLCADTCEPPPPPLAILAVDKSANTTFNRTYAWTVAKTFVSLKNGNTTLVPSNGVFTVPLNATLTANYDVTVGADTPPFTDNGWTVSGTITVTNSSLDGYASITNLADVMYDASATSLGLTVTFSNCNPNVPSTLNPAIIPDHGGTLTCDYSATFGSQPSYDPTVYYNVATVTAVLTPNGSPTDISNPAPGKAFKFGATFTQTNKCVTASDTFNGGASTSLGTVCVDDQPPPPTTFHVGKTVGPFTDDPANCGATKQITNTATISGTTVNVTTPVVTTTLSIFCQACTPGYWKNNDFSNTSKPINGTWLGTPFATASLEWATTPSLVFGNVNAAPWTTTFSGSTYAIGSKNLGAYTMLDALGFNPATSDLSGKAQILLRAGTAALLNATWTDGSHTFLYPLTATQVRAKVIDALTTPGLPTNGYSGLVNAAADLDKYNNNSCPISSKGIWSAK